MTRLASPIPCFSMQTDQGTETTAPQSSCASRAPLVETVAPRMFDADAAPQEGNALLRYADPVARHSSPRSSGSPTGGRGCIVCGAVELDTAGDVKHQAYCPLFMRGPDEGGDPAEWQPLF